MMQLTQFLMLTAFLSWLVFTLAYGLLAPFWKTSLGRNYFGLAFFLMAILALVTYSTFVAPALVPSPQNTGRTLWRIFVYGGATIFGLRHLYDFIKQQLKGRYKRLKDQSLPLASDQLYDKE